MIILTQPGIKAFNPKRISSIVKNFEIEYCIAEINDDFDPSESEMEKSGIDFWWSVQGSQLTTDEYKLRKYKGGIVEGIMEQIGVCKEINIAYGIFAIAYGRKADEFQIWERSILR